jgi:hypothetical protein
LCSSLLLPLHSLFTSMSGNGEGEAGEVRLRHAEMVHEDPGGPTEHGASGGNAIDVDDDYVGAARAPAAGAAAGTAEEGEEESAGEVRHVLASNLQQAVALLSEGGPGERSVPIHLFAVAPQCFRNNGAEMAEDDARVTSRLFSRWVTLLATNHRKIRVLDFDGAHFDRNPLLQDEDLARLFGEVLVSHPTIEAIRFRQGSISTAHLRLFTSAVPATFATPLSELLLRNVRIVDRERVELVADMVRRNVQLRTLCLYGSRLVENKSQIIFDALSQNSNLQTLQLQVIEIGTGTLDRAVASTTLRSIRIQCHTCADEGWEALARGLRSNSTLERVHVEGKHGFGGIPACLEELVSTHNSTLRSLDVHLRGFFPTHIPQTHYVRRQAIQGHLRRNGRIRHALEELRGRYHAQATASLWPLVLEMVSPLPTLLFRFLRRGDLNALSELAQQGSRVHNSEPTTPRGSRKRGRLLEN